MKLDSEEQRELLLGIVVKSTFTISGENLMNAAIQVESLKLAISKAEVEETEDAKVIGHVEPAE